MPQRRIGARGLPRHAGRCRLALLACLLLAARPVVAPNPPPPPSPSPPPSPPPLPPAPTLCSKLVNRWMLNTNAASGLTVVDSVGTLNGSATAGCAYSSTDLSGAMIFDGATCAVQMIGATAYNGGQSGFSLLFWGRVDSTAVNSRFVIYGNGGSEIFVSPFGATGVLSLNVGGTALATSFVPSVGAWNHYALTIGSNVGLGAQQIIPVCVLFSSKHVTQCTSMERKSRPRQASTTP